MEELPLVDFPLFSQADDVPEKLLMQMDSEDLSHKSRDRIKNLAQNGIPASMSLKKIQTLILKAK